MRDMPNDLGLGNKTLPCAAGRLHRLQRFRRDRLWDKKLPRPEPIELGKYEFIPPVSRSSPGRTVEGIERPFDAGTELGIRRPARPRIQQQCRGLPVIEEHFLRASAQNMERWF